MKYRVVEGRPYHCGQIARLMRPEQRECVLRAGLDPHREIAARFKASVLKRAWLIDGRLAGLGGIVGDMLSPHGFIWVVLGREATLHPVALIREGRRQLAEIMRAKEELATLIVPEDLAAVKMAVFLGFHVGHEGIGAPALSRRDRAALYGEVTGNRDLRVPVGAASAVAMGYHREEIGSCA